MPDSIDLFVSQLFGKSLFGQILSDQSIEVFVCSSLAELDFRIGGTIKTSYNKNAAIGDSSTIVLNIITYVSKKLITLQAEISSHFPDIMKADDKDFYNLVYFEELEDSLTRVASYGIGYKNNPTYKALLKFFIYGNEMSYLNLIKYLETGQSVKF